MQQTQPIIVSSVKATAFEKGSTSLMKLFFCSNNRLTVLSICLLLFSGYSHAQTYRTLDSAKKQVIYFDLPSQPLKNGLIEFAIQSKLSVIVEAETLEGFKSKPIVGPFYPEDALKLLLSKSPLTYSVYQDSNSFVITPNKKIVIDDTQSPTINESLSTENIEEIIIKGRQFPLRYNTISNSQMYGNNTSFSAARFINSLPANLVSDQKPDNLNDLLKLSSGVTPGDGLADSNDDFYIRGFPRYGVYVDGFRLSADTGTKLFTENMEQVEILKGPSTLFYGQAEPGGIVNVVRKKPQAIAQREISVGSGSNSERIAATDLTGPLSTVSPNLLYRFVGAQQSQSNYRNLEDVSQELLAPSLTWLASENTTLSVSYERQQSSHLRKQGTVIIAPLQTGVDIVSVDGSVSQARAGFSASQYLTSVDFQHFFHSGWSVNGSYVESDEKRLGIRANREDLFSSDLLIDKEDLNINETIIVNGIVFQGTNVSKRNQWLPVALIHSLYDEQSSDNTTYFTAKINGHYALSDIENEMTFGASLEKNTGIKKYVLEFRSDIEALELSNRGDSEILEAVEATFSERPSLGELQTKAQRLRSRDTGIFLLNTTHISDKWQLSLGGRSSMTEAEYINSSDLLTQKLKNYSQLSKELGIHYQAVDDMSVYFNYSEGFKANYQIDDVQTTIDKPELSTQLELGIKSLLFNDTVTSTVAVFDIDKNNVVSIEFIEGNRTASVNGKQNSKGIDMDFNFQASPSFNVVGSFSLIEPRIGSGAFEGNMPALSSKKVASAFLHYSASKRSKQGFAFNIGSYYVGKRYGSNDNNIHTAINAFSTIDLGSSYRFTLGPVQYTLQLSVKNALDESYILSTEGRLRSNQGADRRFLANISLHF